MAVIPAADEVLLFDNSYLGHSARRLIKPERYEHWPTAAIERIGAAIPALSVITIAEHRAGWIFASWSQARREEAERLLRAYTWIPLDAGILDRWAQLDAECRRVGHKVDDNDKWVAATAIEHDLVLVTCDKAQSELPGLKRCTSRPTHPKRVADPGHGR
jgi:predicted nucleic acid-binding protein